MGKAVIAIVMAGLLTSGLIFYITHFLPGTTNQSENLFVQRVIDGDTLILSNGQRVRLIGIDAPEANEQCFDASRDFLVELVSGQLVEVQLGREQYDKYGRLLAYIYRDSELINLTMVESGFAVAFPFEPNLLHAEEFAAAEQSAREQQRGCLWNP